MNEPMNNSKNKTISDFHESLVSWCKDDFAKAKGIYVPISGGSDGALLANIIHLSYPQKTYCVHFGNSKSLKAADWFEEQFNVVYKDIVQPLEFAEEKRWHLLQTMALAKNFWIAGSRNKTESVIGNFSLASSVCRVFPIANVWKSDVMLLGKYLGFPDKIMQSSRKADPTCGRTQEMVDIGIERTDLFFKIKLGLEPEAKLADFSKNEAKSLNGWYKRNTFKRNPVRYGPERG